MAIEENFNLPPEKRKRDMSLPLQFFFPSEEREKMKREKGMTDAEIDAEADARTARQLEDWLEKYRSSAA